LAGSEKSTPDMRNLLDAFMGKSQKQGCDAFVNGGVLLELPYVLED